MKIERKQRWIPVPLIELAERIADHIRKEQSKGKLMDFPPNPSGAQVLNMALAKGLVRMAQEIGMTQAEIEKQEKLEPEPEKQTTPPQENDRARDFLEKLMGGLGG